MNSNKPDQTSAGSLTRSVRSAPPVTVDCSDWDREVPAERWSTGKLVRVTAGQLAGPGTFIPAHILELEVSLRIAAGVKPAHAFAFAARLVTEVVAYDPDLALTYNLTRSRETDGGVVMVLSPARPGPDTEARLERIAAAIRQATTEACGIALNGVHVQHAA